MEANERREPFEERHFTVPQLAEMWNLSREFVRQVVQGEPGVTEWVWQQPGRRRYRVLRVPRSVAERLYHRALGKAEDEAAQSEGRNLGPTGPGAAAKAMTTHGAGVGATGQPIPLRRLRNAGEPWQYNDRGGRSGAAGVAQSMYGTSDAFVG